MTKNELLRLSDGLFSVARDLEKARLSLMSTNEYFDDLNSSDEAHLPLILNSHHNTGVMVEMSMEYLANAFDTAKRLEGMVDAEAGQRAKQ